MHTWQEERANNHDQIKPKRLEEELSKEKLPRPTSTAPVSEATLRAAPEKVPEVPAVDLEKEPMMPLTVSGRNSKNDPDLSKERGSDLRARIAEAQKGNKVDRKGEKASAMKSKPAKKKKVQDLSEDDLSEDDALDHDEEPVACDKKAGLHWAALLGICDQHFSHSH